MAAPALPNLLDSETISTIFATWFLLLISLQKNKLSIFLLILSLMMKKEIGFPPLNNALTCIAIPKTTTLSSSSPQHAETILNGLTRTVGAKNLTRLSIFQQIFSQLCL